jgi:hypothetical protein
MRSVNTTQTTPWTAGNLYAQGPTAGRIEAVGAGATDESSYNGLNTASVVIMPSSYNAGGDASYTVGVGANGNYQHMVSILDVLQQLDITKVGLATEDTASNP